MKPFVVPRTIGCPYHARAAGQGADVAPRYQLLDGSYRTVASNRVEDSYLRQYGPAVMIRHPNAPTAQRTENQQVYDAARQAIIPGHAHRDYALAVGHTRSINGADGGVGIGTNRWLYCDPGTHATWIISMRTSLVRENPEDWAATALHVEIWLDGLFGWFGRDYDIPERKLCEMDWVPEDGIIPLDQNTGVTLLLNGLYLDWSPMLAFSNDGAVCYINLMSEGDGPFAPSGVYLPTADLPTAYATAWCGILRVNLSGSSSPANGGAAITGTIVRDMPYMDGQAISYSVSAGITSHDAILYRTPYGDVRRTWTVNSADDTFIGTMSAFGVEKSFIGTSPISGGWGTQITIAAQNAVYFCNFKDDGITGAFYEAWIGLDADNNGVTLNANTRFDDYDGTGGDGTEFPSTRRKVMTYDPGDPAGTLSGPGLYTSTENTEYTGVTLQRF